MESLQHSLEDEGFVVVRNVVSHDTVQEAQSEIWSFIEGISNKVKRSESSTWVEENWLDGFCGIINYSIGHSNFMWKLRSNPRLLEVFSNIWTTPKSNLLSSFDGCNASCPKLSNSRTAAWPHVDQAYLGRSCIQGFVCLTDSLVDEDGGLYVIRGSHKDHERIFSGLSSERATQFTLQELCKHYGSNYAAKVERVNCRAGDLVLWDSRTCHWAQEPLLDGRAGVRMVAYICMTPRDFSTPQDIEKKKRAFIEGRMTSHLPHSVHLVEEYYANVRNLKGYKLIPLAEDSVTDQIAQLAGFQNRVDYLQYIDPNKM